AFQVTRPEAPKAAWYASSNAYLAVAALENPGASASDPPLGTSPGDETHAQADLLRCVFGNPFQPLALHLAWRTSDVLRLAEGIYAERTFDGFPILADAAEEAGCTDARLLGHLRGPGPHVRGCWALDLILSKDR